MPTVLVQFGTRHILTLSRATTTLLVPAQVFINAFLDTVNVAALEDSYGNMAELLSSFWKISYQSKYRAQVDNIIY
jgi:hypothetical protein